MEKERTLTPPEGCEQFDITAYPTIYELNVAIVELVSEKKDRGL